MEKKYEERSTIELLYIDGIYEGEVDRKEIWGKINYRTIYIDGIYEGEGEGKEIWGKI